jgi:hypothetical protein
MLEADPVRAFVDNYVWMIRAPRDPSVVALVDPGNAAPVEDALERQE